MPRPATPKDLVSAWTSQTMLPAMATPTRSRGKEKGAALRACGAER
ncbi:hypothetical protein [Actinacidiphila sp. ITFR-21]|nr:hypothetical protein [Streptomyces sp. ITFR-21]WNI20063.1 hypothetical protein RLT57_31485 [Streptomyces sp. ITFR-21]